MNQLVVGAFNYTEYVLENSKRDIREKLEENTAPAIEGQTG
jgi:hypothetical protein